MTALAFRDGRRAGGEQAEAVEAMAGEMLLQLTVRLNELQFRPLFLRALQWATEDSSSAVAGAEVAMLDALVATAKDSAANGPAAPSRPRAISFFRAIAPSQAKLAGLYTSYFRLALPHATVLLQPSAHANSVQIPSEPPAKRRRRPNGTNGTPSLADKAAEDGADEAELALCLRSTLLFVKLGLTNGGASAATLAQMHALEAPLLDHLSSDDPPPAGGPLDRCQTEVLEAMAALVRSLGVSESKRLHFELCNRTRSEETRKKLGALRGLATLYEALGADALVYVAEAVPFVSELMEDAETSVRTEALELMRVLESLSEEGFDM
mmetsp:Transcript_15491/g.38866  ORF Transcript_15491/g.38866 Transcript_15491/m.38866 type:complete len:324 (+) Transcript_15491:1-972(+)